MSLSTLTLTLLSLLALTQGSCWRYGHSCWGGHGKRSGEPPGGFEKGGHDSLVLRPPLVTSNSRGTGDYDGDLQETESGAEDLSVTSDELFENGGKTRRRQNLNFKRRSEILNNQDFAGFGFLESGVGRDTNSEREAYDDNTNSHMVEVDLDGGEVIDPDLLTAAEQLGSREFLDRARKGPPSKRRPTVLIYQFQRRRR